MSKNIQQIKSLIKKECSKGLIADWFFSVHLLGVEKFAKWLLSKLPKANKGIVMLGVWLHDLQRIRGLKGDHQKIGAREAEKVTKQFGYNKLTIDKVQKIILSHSCFNDQKPKTVEGKILATADAMAHYHNDFYLQIAVTGQRSLKGYKEWVLEKLDRNYNVKICFPFAKKKIKARHDLFKKVFTMK